MKKIKQLVSFLLLCFIFFCCQENKNKYIGEWDKLNSSKYIDRLIFSEKDGKIILKWVQQNVEKYKGIEKEYPCDIDEQGNIVIHSFFDVKGNIVDNKLFLRGDTYERRAKQ